MAKTIAPYDQAQNNYASGLGRTNAENIGRIAAEAGVATALCVKVVPVDAQGRVLEAATVTLNGTAGTVANVGNVIYVAPFAAAVTCKVECEGFETTEITINVADVDVHKEVTLQTAASVRRTIRQAYKRPANNFIATVAKETPQGEESSADDGTINFAPYVLRIKIDDAELADGQENKEIAVKVTGTCPLSESGKKRFPGCADLASALKKLLDDGALTLKSTTVIQGDVISLKSPFRVSDVEIEEKEFTAIESGTTDSSSAISLSGLYVLSARTVLYFYLVDSDASFGLGDTYVCKLGDCPDGYTRAIPVVEGGDATIKQNVNFVLELDK